jgi:Arc/MetJ family transcription regulator
MSSEGPWGSWKAPAFKCRFDYVASMAATVRPGCGVSHIVCFILCVESMATNLSIDPELIEWALKVSGERTKKAAVTKALQKFIARRRQKRLLELMGKL